MNSSLPSEGYCGAKFDLFVKTWWDERLTREIEIEIISECKLHRSVSVINSTLHSHLYGLGSIKVQVLNLLKDNKSYSDLFCISCTCN